jgi:hypothetical protein
MQILSQFKRNFVIFEWCWVHILKVLNNFGDFLDVKLYLEKNLNDNKEYV